MDSMYIHLILFFYTFLEYLHLGAGKTNYSLSHSVTLSLSIVILKVFLFFLCPDKSLSGFSMLLTPRPA